MSIVCYVVHADHVDVPALAARLREDGFAVDATGSSLTVSDGPEQVLVGVETRASNEALDPTRWPDRIGAALRARPASISLQAIGDSLGLLQRVATSLAERLDGYIYDESSGELTGPVGAEADAAQDDDPEVTIDWAALPDASARPFAIVCRWTRAPSLYALDALLETLDVGLGRTGSYIGREKAPDSDRWRNAAYLGSCGEMAVFDRPSAAYVRITFDVEEMMMDRTFDFMRTLVELAQRLMPLLREHAGAVPIDLES